MRSICGGELTGLSKLTRETRDELIAEISEKAKQMGANAITGLRIETDAIFEGTIDMVVYGTAIFIHK